MTTHNIFTFFRSHIEKRVTTILSEQTSFSEEEIQHFKFETPPDRALGHIAFACFPLARKLKNSPPNIAKHLLKLWGDDAHFNEIKAVGPYLNFFLSPLFLADSLLEICINDATFGNSEIGKGKHVMLEFSSPNTNKPLHLGHCRNNLLGMTLARIFEGNGFKVTKVNLVNDRGIHICKSMLAYQRWGEGETPENSGKKGDKLVGNYYVLFDQKLKENKDLEQAAQEMLLQWEQGNEEIRALWKKMNRWVLDGFKSTYRRTGVEFDLYYFESETYLNGKTIVADALAKKVCHLEENGAIAIDLEAEGLGTKILLRGDGTSMYITQDISTTVLKHENYDLDHCLFVVGNEQDNHFQVLFKTLEKMGYHWASECEHISYGMITLPEGKMKSREGTVVDLDNLLDMMTEMALKEIETRVNINAQDAKATAEAIGQAAIKFYILKTNASRQIQFDPKESISFDGVTGPYIQYTHARICSILRKSGITSAALSYNGYQWNNEELDILVQLSLFSNAIELAAVERNPAVICAYMYDLSRYFNKFYNSHQILKADSTQALNIRLQLIRAVKALLSKSLIMLGIEPLERM